MVASNKEGVSVVPIREKLLTSLTQDQMSALMNNLQTKEIVDEINKLDPNLESKEKINSIINMLGLAGPYELLWLLSGNREQFDSSIIGGVKQTGAYKMLGEKITLGEVAIMAQENGFLVENYGLN